MAKNVTSDTTVVLVTGGNQGIGYEVVKKLASEHPDYHLILCGRRSDAVQEAVSSLEKLGLGVTPLVMDINSDESIHAAAATVDRTFGRLDVLVNNAAVSGIDIADVRHRMQAVYDTNVFGTAAVTDAFIPLLAKSTQKAKRVVFVSSTLGSLTLKMDPVRGAYFHKLNYAAYSTSKSALNMLALHYAVDHEDDPTWKFNIADPGHHCATMLNNFQGPEKPELGAISICQLATLGADGESGTYINDSGILPW